MDLLVVCAPLLLYSVLALGCGAPVYLAGKHWELPDSRIAQEESWRRRVPNDGFFVTGNFLMDGVDDCAFLAVDKRSKILGLLLRSALTSKIIVLDELPGDAEAMALRRVGPGRYQVICSRDEPCTASGRKKVTIQTGLAYYKFGSAGRLFFFDPKRKKMVSRWDSD
jgi:hypothetical protein